MKIKTTTASFFSENGFWSVDSAYFDLLDNIKNYTDRTDVISTNGEKHMITVTPGRENSYLNMLIQDFNNLKGVKFFLTLDAYYNVKFDKTLSDFIFVENNELANSNTLTLTLNCSTVYEDEQIIFDNSAAIRRELYQNLISNDFNYKIAVIYFKYIDDTVLKEDITFSRYNINTNQYEKFLGDIIQFQCKFNLDKIIEQLNNPSETFENLKELNSWITTIDALSASESLVLALRDELKDNYRKKFLALEEQ